ncbi:hypothetical protein BC829DRAFT_407743 [Chytridium lagenaria]|nr:hypothetical protein BC829DRAFT_407743 [Chytridium lagenaria]
MLYFLHAFLETFLHFPVTMYLGSLGAYNYARPIFTFPTKVINISFADVYHGND